VRVLRTAWPIPDRWTWRLPITLRLSEALAFAWASLTATTATLIPMIDVLHWVGANAQVRGLSVEGAEKVVSAVLEYACDAASRRARENSELHLEAEARSG
jgi:hypothetical protein